MNEALGYLYTIYDRFITFVFSTMSLFTGVTFGWVLVSVLLIGTVAKSVLNMPKGLRKTSVPFMKGRLQRK